MDEAQQHNAKVMVALAEVGGELKLVRALIEGQNKLLTQRVDAIEESHAKRLDAVEGRVSALENRERTNLWVVGGISGGASVIGIIASQWLRMLK